MDSRPPRMGSPAAVRNATSACPLPRRFVQAQVEELCEGDVKLKSLPTERVVNKFAEAILTSFRLELSLPPYLAAPARPLDSELRRQLQGMRAAFPMLLGGRSDELLVAWYDREELVDWLVPPSQPRPTSVSQEAPAAAHAELSTKRRGGASPKRRPSRSRFPRSESPKGRGADAAGASLVATDVAAVSSVAPPPPAASTSLPLPPTPASVASTVAPSALAHPTAVTTAATATTATTAATAATAAATTAAAAATTAAASVVADPAPSDCPRPARPYHTLLTASSGAYQLWQTRVFHHHYLRIQRQDRCGEVGGFTRLLTQPAGAKPDGLMAVMRTVVVAELAKGEDLGFVVLNRPNSVVKAFESGQLVFEERFVLVCETDHLLLKPMPNLATETEAVGYPFHYMLPTKNPKTVAIVRRFAGSDAAAAAVQQVGPSPVLVLVESLKRVAPDWLKISFDLKRDPEADAEFGWMLEMWGYSIACGMRGLRHRLPDNTVPGVLRTSSVAKRRVRLRLRLRIGS